MYLQKLKKIFSKKEPFLSQEEIHQEQEELTKVLKCVNYGMEIFKSVLEFLLGYRILPHLYSIPFFLLSLSSLCQIILIRYKTHFNSYLKIIHSLLFQGLYFYQFEKLDFSILYLIYVSTSIENSTQKILYYLIYQLIFELLRTEVFQLFHGEIIFSWMILATICLNIFITQKRIVSTAFTQFSLAKDADSYEEFLFDINEKHYLVILKVTNSEVLYVNKPFLKRFGAQTSIIGSLEQFVLQTEQDVIIEANKSSDHYFQKSTNIIESLTQQDFFSLVPLNTHAYLDSQTYRVNIQMCSWKNQQSYAITIINITDEQAISEYKKLDSYKDNILSTVSHDLKNPIGAIQQTLMFVLEDLQALSQRNNELCQSVNFVEICLNNISFLSSFVKDLSDFQMIKMQKLKLIITEVDLIKLFSDIKKAFQLQFSVKQIEFQTKIKLEKNQIKNDEVRLKQVLFNLISNSYKFTMNGQILLQVTDNNQEIQEFYINVKNQMKQNKSKQNLKLFEAQLNNILLITVSDSGVGMTEDIKCQLFKSYSTFDNEKKQNKNGVGLGLMISKQLCGYVGPLRYIYINSKVGIGTNFQFVVYKIHNDNMDVEEDEPIKIHQIKQSKTPKQTPINKQRSVLLVDDELFNNATNKQLFQLCGVSKISIAYSASEATQMIRQSQFDIVVLDVNLPDKSGVCCIKEIKKFNKNAKIYILSAFDDPETKQMCLKEGADRIFSKPLTQKQILNIL